MGRDLRSWPRLALVVLACGVGLLLRLRGLTAQPLFGDEYHTLLAADQGYWAILTRFDTVGSHAALPLLQRLSLDLFGEGVLSFRLVGVVPGVLTVLLAFPLLRGFFGPDPAALATALLALSPMHVYYSRFARGYALVVLLALVLGASLLRLLDGRPARPWTWAALVLSAALLPWVHLSSAGFVAALGASALVLGARRSRALARRLLLALAAAGVLALVLYLPLIGQVREYFRVMKPEEGPLGWTGIPTLVAGDRVAAAVWLLALPVAVLVLWRERAQALAVALAALLGPLVFLLATRPRGMDYAWSRYLLSALPFVAALVAAAFLHPTRWLPARARWSGLVLGAALLALQYARGPLAGAGLGAFDNTYLAMHRLPAFDEPWPELPAVYRELAADPTVQRVVESPVILTRAVLLYRAYARAHGKQVLMGWVGEMPRGVRGPPYVRLLEIEPGQADYLLLHRDLKAEVFAYFHHVYETVWPRLASPLDESFMRRQEAVYAGSFDPPERTAAIAARLFTHLGPADFKDGSVLGWRLKE